MSKLEDALRQALRRREPPAGLAERVLARVRARERQKRRPRLLEWRWLAAVAALIILSVGLPFLRERRRRLEGERAKEQVMLALRVTGSQLRLVQARLEKVIGPASAPQN